MTSRAVSPARSTTSSPGSALGDRDESTVTKYSDKVARAWRKLGEIRAFHAKQTAEKSGSVVLRFANPKSHQGGISQIGADELTKMARMIGDALADEVGRGAAQLVDRAVVAEGHLGQQLGLGLGRYPAAYFWEPGAPRPSALGLGHDDSGAFIQIGPPAGVTEPIRFSQRIPIDTAGVARYSLKARSEQDAVVSVSICRKHLLYSDSCATQSLPIIGGKGWRSSDMPKPRSASMPAGARPCAG